MSDSNIEELVAESKKPGTFSIVNTLKDRAYPKDDVAIYIDERAAYLASEANEKIREIDNNIDKIINDEGAVKELDKLREEVIQKRDELLKNFENSKYIFTIRGISEGRREDIISQVNEKHPVKYFEDKNMITGEVIRTERENPERDAYITNLLWKDHIEKIVSPGGEQESNLSLADVKELRRALPIAASTKINESIEKIRTATALFMFSVDEDFLAKS